MNSNPVLVILNGLAATVALVLVATNTTGVTHLDPASTTAVVAAIAGVCNLIGLAIRAAVVPVGVHAEQVAQALATPPPGTGTLNVAGPTIKMTPSTPPPASQLQAAAGTELAAAQAQTERPAAGA